MVQAPSITTTVADGLRGAERHDALVDPTVRQRLTDLGQETPPPEQQTPEALAAHQKADSKRRTSRPSEPTWILSSATHVLPIGHQANLSISGWNKVVSSPADVYDAKGCLACPGLIETHIHLDKSRIIDRCAPQERKTLSPVKGVSPLKESMSVEDVHARAERTLQDCIKHGTTRMRTQVEVDPAVGMRGFE